MAEAKVQGLQETPKGEVDAASWLYMAEGAALGYKPFIVGLAKIKVYGGIAQLVSRCEFFEALADDLKSLEAINEQNPLALLADDKRFDQGMLESFKIVWNYINGVYPDLVLAKGSRTSKLAIWPREGMSIEEKYRVLYFIDYFGVPIGTDSQFVEQYLRLAVYDLISELRTASERYAAFAGSQAQQAVGQEYNRLIGMALGLRALIVRTYTEGEDYLGGLAMYMPQEQKQEMKYGKRDSHIPAAYREIYPEEAVYRQFPSSALIEMIKPKGFDARKLNEAKDLILQVYYQGKSIAVVKVIKTYNPPAAGDILQGWSYDIPHTLQVGGTPAGSIEAKSIASYDVEPIWLTPGIDNLTLLSGYVDVRAFSA